MVSSKWERVVSLISVDFHSSNHTRTTSQVHPSIATCICDLAFWSWSIFTFVLVSTFDTRVTWWYPIFLACRSNKCQEVASYDVQSLSCLRRHRPLCLSSWPRLYRHDEHQCTVAVGCSVQFVMFTPAPATLYNFLTIFLWTWWKQWAWQRNAIFSLSCLR